MARQPMSFYMRGIWHVVFVDQDSEELIDRTGVKTVATTDPVTRCIYLSNSLEGDFLNRVLIHELAHCVMISYDLLEEIHRMVRPEYWVEMEEWICNFIADYGVAVYYSAYHILGDDAWRIVPYELKRIIA